MLFYKSKLKAKLNLRVKGGGVVFDLESERILAVIPWAGKLQPDNKAKFKDDLKLLLATTDLTEDELLRILEFMDDWKATAQVDGDPHISSFLRRKRRIKDCQQG